MSDSVDNERKLRGDLIDFHTHILPRVDDGSRSTDESLQMIRVLSNDGISNIALTPHFYAASDTPERFFSRRESSLAALQASLDSQADLSHIKLIPGAEIQYFEGITVMSELEGFTLGNRGCLLVEMPMCRWATHMVDDILELQSRGGLKIVLAHVERYLFAQKKETVHRLLAAGVQMQANASFFIDRMSRRRAVNLMKKGFIHVIGSDCHNMQTRSPKIGKAYDIVSKTVGAYAVDEINYTAGSLLGI